MLNKRTTIFAANRFDEAHSDVRIQVVNPFTEQPIGYIPDGDEHDVDIAVSSARKAINATDWPQLAPQMRATFLRSLADELDLRSEELSSTITAQNGMPISMSRATNGEALSGTYRYFASLADELRLEEVRLFNGNHTIVRREPIGVAALVVAWNAPQTLISWKLGPALAAGCSVVIKPSPETTLDAYILAEAVVAAGIPAGVVNIVPGGAETGAALVGHPGIDKVAFTGSGAVGKTIGIECASLLRPVTLELGGKSAAIILDDADLPAFGPLVERVCSSNSGQVCRACTRILTPRSMYEATIDVVADAMRNVSMGDPMDPLTVFGPLVSGRQRDRVESYIRIGQEEGARIVVGGGRPSEFPNGFFVEPTVFRDVDNDMRIAQEEIFGPVLAVIPYDNDDDAVRLANDSMYGLGGFIHTADPERGTRMARRIQTGTIGINQGAIDLGAPFGGYKQSGIGRELGPEGISPYLQFKSMYCV